MQFDPENNIVKLCAKGIMTEGEGKVLEAYELYQQAWDLAQDGFEKFTAAHYLARGKKDPLENLKWNEIALNHALLLNNDFAITCYPSLYLNVGKSYEDIGDFTQAMRNYLLAETYTDKLPEDGFGNMLKLGIVAGIKRVQS